MEVLGVPRAEEDQRERDSGRAPKRRAPADGIYEETTPQGNDYERARTTKAPDPDGKPSTFVSDAIGGKGDAGWRQRGRAQAGDSKSHKQNPEVGRQCHNDRARGGHE